MNFGEAIRVGRETRGVSQRELAEQADLDASYVSLVESGKRTPSMKTIEAIAQALNIPFYLLALLASEENDLHGISPAHASELAQNLLAILLSADQHQ